MSQKLNESGAMPAAVALIAAENPTNYALPPSLGRQSGTLTPAEAPFLSPRTDQRGADRLFLLWCLAGLIIATVTCGAIAMSAIVM